MKKKNINLIKTLLGFAVTGLLLLDVGVMDEAISLQFLDFLGHVLLPD